MSPEVNTHEPPVDDPRVERARPARSIVVVNTGDGKGKSTAAFGIVMRAVARDWNVAVVQFIKSGKWKVGEEATAKRLGVDWWAIGEGFTWDSSDLTEDQAVAQAGWRHAAEIINGGRHRLVVLDEVTYPVNWGWIPVGDVASVIKGRPEDVNVVITGRDAPEPLTDLADTVTEMRNVKHAYDRGIAAKKGIDY